MLRSGLFCIAEIFFFGIDFCNAQAISVKGIVFDKDSVTPLSFAYVAAKNTRTGTLTDEDGKFSIAVKMGDTLVFSYLGYSVAKIKTHMLKDTIKNNLLQVKIFLKPKATELKPVVITTNEFTKDEKEFYQRKIDEYYTMTEHPLQNPISAMYYAFSKEGKQLKKLTALYEQLLTDEIREHRLSDEKVRTLVGNDTLNTSAFFNHCKISNELVLNATDYDLYAEVNKCYKQYIELCSKKK